MLFSTLPFMPLLLLLCTTLFAQQKGTFTDTRDGKVYKTTKIGEQVWMAENLNYEASGSKCYNNKQANCDKYGRLYNWNTAKKACPNGWHLPSKVEWKILIEAVGSEKTAGRYLKATSGWNENGNGEDKFEFAVLPGGNVYSSGNFDEVGDDGYWWSASESDANSAYYLNMFCGSEDARLNDNNKSLSFSVRCLQNTAK
jgi:uncharacterized protein (TIGR02145 family)